MIRRLRKEQYAMENVINNINETLELYNRFSPEIKSGLKKVKNDYVEDYYALERVIELLTL